MKLLQLQRLDHRGFDHILIGVAFTVIMALGGMYFLAQSHANPWSGALALGSTGSGDCMDTTAVSTGAYVELNNCNNQLDQKWELMNAGTVNGHSAYTIQNYTAGTTECVDDWQQSKAQGMNNPLRLYTCNGVDPAQRFIWAGYNNQIHQLQNVASGLCIDDLGASTAAGTDLDLYPCKTSGASNQFWFEVSNTASAQSGNPNTTTSTAPPVVATNEVMASAGSNLCITAGSTITLQTCNGGASQQWGQVSTASGAATVVLYNAAAKTYLGTSGRSVVETGSSVSASWTPIDNGDGTDTLTTINGSMCLDAPSGRANTQLTLATCDPGTADQSFTLPSPYTAPSSASSGSNSSSASSSATSGSAGDSTSIDDITALLNALKSAKPTFTCTSLRSTTDIQRCRSIFRE